VPVVTSIVVVSILWEFMYQQDGLVNHLLQAVSFNVVQGTDWLNSPSAAMPAIIFMSIWQAVGFHMVIWLAGLQTISADLYEAAELDGAGPWEKFRYVTWPGPAGHPHLHPGDDHDRSFELVRADQGHDQWRTPGLDVDRGVPGCPHRL
jgi:ABC-type polysaccharide transport system permease subunit